MRTVRSLSYQAKKPTVVALGCFDGLHHGHRAVIGEARRMADRLGCELAVWTFEEPPKNYFAPHSVPLITDLPTKKSLLRQMGVDLLICLPFDEKIRTLSAEEFFHTILLRRLQAKHLVCGYNYSFGTGGKGDSKQLHALCQQSGISLTTIPPVLCGNRAVSSSEIRLAIEEGRPEDASRLLGRPYSLRATVVDGRKLGRKLGFPTLNQRFPEGMLIPRRGVYVSRVTYGGRKKPLFGITNVGMRPTVGGHHVVAETHVFDFYGDLYGKQVEVEFLHFIRPEVSFESVDALSAQVHRDMETAKQILSTDKN